MIIRTATYEDLPDIYPIYEAAKQYMWTHGNPNQWSASYPGTMLNDHIDKQRLFVGIGDDGKPHLSFVFYIGDDPTYHVIEGGSWLNDEPYGVIHMVASDGTVSHVLEKILEYANRYTSNIRIDTHKDNEKMNSLLKRYGFTFCGIIYTHNNTKRNAYQISKAQKPSF